jgi:hypothetical protein
VCSDRGRPVLAEHHLPRRLAELLATTSTRDPHLRVDALAAALCRDVRQAIEAEADPSLCAELLLRCRQRLEPLAVGTASAPRPPTPPARPDRLPVCTELAELALALSRDAIPIEAELTRVVIGRPGLPALHALMTLAATIGRSIARSHPDQVGLVRELVASAAAALELVVPRKDHARDVDGVRAR